MATTIDTVWVNFFTFLEELTMGGTPLFAEVVEGETVPQHFQIPFLAVQLLDFEVGSRASDLKKLWKAKFKLRIVCSSPGSGSGAGTSAVASLIADVEDKIDAWVRPVDVTGPEDAAWSVNFSIQPDVGNIITADSVRTMSIMVARGAN